MPSAKRSPISYAPTFGGGIFRPKSAVDSDLALLDPETEADQLPDSAPEAPLESASTEASSQSELPREKQPPTTRRAAKRAKDSTIASVLASTSVSEQASKRASVEASEQARAHVGAAPISPDTMEMIRKVVKEPGREVTYVRLSPEEKAQLSDAVYAFKRRGQKITETEISRLAVNYILADYNEYGDESLLARLVASLRA